MAAGRCQTGIGHRVGGHVFTKEAVSSLLPRGRGKCQIRMDNRTVKPGPANEIDLQFLVTLLVPTGA